MQSSILTLTIMALFAGASPAAEPPAPSPSPAVLPSAQPESLAPSASPVAATRPATQNTASSEVSIPDLIRQLNAQRFQDREAAQARLMALGEPALPALRQAQHNDDPEIAARASAAIQSILRDRSYGQAVDGLRCRWLPTTQPVAVGTAPDIALEVENTSKQPLIWYCTKWNCVPIWPHAADPPQRRLPAEINVVPGDGARSAMVAETLAAAGVDHVGAQATDPMPGYYLLGPGARVEVRTRTNHESRVRAVPASGLSLVNRRGAW